MLDRTGATGKPNARRAQYVCTAEGCPARASIGAAQLDAYVDSLLMQSRSQEHLPQTMPCLRLAKRRPRSWLQVQTWREPANPT